MKADVARFTPFDLHFNMTPLLVTSNADTANTVEKDKIRSYNATCMYGICPKGYNVFIGAPKNTNMFWAMMQAKKKHT